MEQLADHIQLFVKYRIIFRKHISIHAANCMNLGNFTGKDSEISSKSAQAGSPIKLAANRKQKKNRPLHLMRPETIGVRESRGRSSLEVARRAMTRQEEKERTSKRGTENRSV